MPIVQTTRDGPQTALARRFATALAKAGLNIVLVARREAALRRLAARRSGGIMLMSSLVAFQGVPRAARGRRPCQRAGMLIRSGQTPNEVAEASLRALGRHRTGRPAFLAKALEAALMPLPRVGRVKMMAKVMAGLRRSFSESPTLNMG